MTILSILRDDNPRLRQPCQPVERVQNVQNLAEDMIATMRAAHGIGLAAPQVGHPVRLVVVGAGTWRKFPLVLINPVVTPIGDKRTTEQEGCLSLGSRRVQVRRHDKIHVEALSINGQPMSFNAKGMQARCIQHEVDHLDGVLITDRSTA